MAIITEPTANIQALAEIALREPNFRMEASVRGGFQAALAKYQHDNVLQDEAEIQFCEGWLDLARLEFGEIPDNLDRNLVIRVKAELAQSQTRAG